MIYCECRTRVGCQRNVGILCRVGERQIRSPPSAVRMALLAASYVLFSFAATNEPVGGEIMFVQQLVASESARTLNAMQQGRKKKILTGERELHSVLEDFRLNQQAQVALSSCAVWLK